jgi:predicted O-methyltransferase YrrM
VTLERWSEVDRFLAGLFAPADAALDGATVDSAAAGLPSIQVSTLQGGLLHVLALAVRARSILEIGTLGGYSTIWLARALPPEGRMVTLELDPGRADVARANLDRAGLSGVVEVRVGDALESLAALATEGRTFDFVFLDADKPGYPAYLEWSIRLADPGALLVADNVVREGDIADDAGEDPDVVGVRRFLELLAADPRVRAAAVQTVGSKGHDGLAIAVVRPEGPRASRAR